MADAPGGQVACVVDAAPRFHWQVLRWYVCLTRLAAVEPAALVVAAVGGLRSDVLRLLSANGVRVIDVAGFDPRSPHCNKISGALALAETPISGPIVLTDCDVAFLADPRQLVRNDARFLSKPVDVENPPLEVLAATFKAAGLTPPAVVPLAGRSDQRTFAGNGNGGLYALSASDLPLFARHWGKWARWLLDRPDLLGAYGVFVDQVAAAMALHELGWSWVPLPTHWNAPTHIPSAIGGDTLAAALHYHDAVDVMGLLRPTGLPLVDSSITRVNEALGKFLHEHFPNATFWDWRYSRDPELGSGVGSRGEALIEKRLMLQDVLDELQPASMLDVGCGDGEAVQGLRLPAYSAVDVSREAIALISSKVPGAIAAVGRLSDVNWRAELVVCLDVLIHVSELDDYRNMVRALLAAATGALVVSGYEQDPSSPSPMVHFHEPLSATIRRAAPTAVLEARRQVHGITTWLVRA
jgi:2-polyprenyl-3-methyl-5-hydroxy-6-metoxy-1,4-benzoquinol methylase